MRIELKPGDEVRIDPSHRIAIERLEDRKADTHLLDEVPTVTWEQIGGQQAAIAAIRKAIEYPLLHAETFAQYRFTQPKGFLLRPSGVRKDLNRPGRPQLVSRSWLAKRSPIRRGILHSTRPPHTRRVSDPIHASDQITGGVFLHVKGPEILNMWLGESERMVRDLFAQARARRKAGSLPVHIYR